MADPHAFVTWFDRQLKRFEWTPSDFVQRSGIPKSTVYSWLNGSRSPRAEHIETIADVLGRRKNDVLVIAGIADPEPDRDPEGPEAILFPLIRQVRWTDDDLMRVENDLRFLIGRQRKRMPFHVATESSEPYYTQGPPPEESDTGEPA